MMANKKRSWAVKTFWAQVAAARIVLAPFLLTVFPLTVFPLTVVALAVFPLTGCFSSEAGAAKANATESSVGTASDEALAVTRGTFRSRVLLTGELKASDAVFLSAPDVNIWPLQVRWVEEDGVDVAEGDLLVEFDSSQLTNNLDEMYIRALEAESELESEQARVASEVEEAELDLQRQRAEEAKARLDAKIPAKLRSGQEYQSSQLALKEAQLKLEGGQRRLDNARQSGVSDIELKTIGVRKAHNEVARVEATVRTLTLQAPRDGILIVGENFREGRPLRPGDTAFPGQIVAQLPDLATLGVEGRLFDVDDGRVQVGQRARARLDAFPDHEFAGRVTEMEEMANQIGSRSLRRFFTVRVVLDQVDLELMRPGMSVKVVIEAEPLENVLLVPRAALDFEQGPPRAVLAGGQRVAFELGECNALHCLVESGLTEGQKLSRALEMAR